MKFCYSCLVVSLFIYHSLPAQVINEYSCSNWALTADNNGNYEDWIELYNPTSSVMDIGGYYLSDRISQPLKWRFPANVTINPNSFLLVWTSGRDQTISGNYHTNFRLTQTKFPTEIIVLSDSSGVLIDQVSLEVTANHHSRGRNPDGGSSWKIYTTPTPNAAANAASAKHRYAPRPAFSFSAGFYNAPVQVSMSTSEPGATIRYTTTGLEPTATSAIYSGPVHIDSTRVLKAAVFPSAPDVLPSFTTFGTYFIADFPTLPVVSIAGKDLVTLAQGNGSLRPQGSIEYFNKNRIRTTAGYGEFNRHGQDSWANDQRSLDYIMRDEYGYNYALLEELFSQSTRDEFQRIILRAAGDDNYPADHSPSNDGSAHVRDAYVQNLAKSGGLNLDVRIATKCIVYINGLYWGVYDIRENPDDHDYTEYYYGQGKFKLQYIETWGSTWAEYGGNQALNDWNAFRSYILNNDMNDPVKWNYVTSTLDVASLADYVIVNSLTVCSDWLNYNTGWWRGLDSTGQHKKWGYILWDNDAVFGFYINYTGIPDKGPYAAPCNAESGQLSDPEMHIDILNKLRTNPSFDNYYISRYIDLENTTFSCDYMLSQLDSIVAVIDPEMNRHAQRWNGTYSEWQTNVQLLRTYIQTRCTAMPNLMDSCFNLTGPYPLVLKTDPIGSGKIKLNSLTITEFPWSGNYYGGIPVNITAYPDTLNNFTFDSWITQNNPPLPSAFNAVAELNLQSGDTITAHFIQHTVSIPEITGTDFDVVAFPSVFNRETTIAYHHPNHEKILIRLINSIGIPVMEITAAQTGQDQNQFSLNFSDKHLKAGMYFLNFSSNSVNKTIRLLYTGQ